jgi:hypothetical protein
MTIHDLTLKVTPPRSSALHSAFAAPLAAARVSAPAYRQEAQSEIWWLDNPEDVVADLEE